MTNDDIALAFTRYTLKRSLSLKLYTSETVRGFQYVTNSVVKRFQPNGRMAGSAHSESGLATVIAIVFVFPFGCTCTGEYDASVVSSGGRYVYCSLCIVQGTAEVRVTGFHMGRAMITNFLLKNCVTSSLTVGLFPSKCVGYAQRHCYWLESRQKSILLVFLVWVVRGESVGSRHMYLLRHRIVSPYQWD